MRIIAMRATRLRLSLSAAVVGLIGVAACGTHSPSAPTQQQPGPAAPNQAPQITATITPATGIDELTTFTARIEVKDPDGDRVSLTASRGCDNLTDTAVDLSGGVGLVSFKSRWNCGPWLTLTATDARGSSTRAQAAAEHKGLGGPLRLVLGDDFYSQPVFWMTLTQSATIVTGTIHDIGHTGTTDPQDPGTIDDEGRFRVRFRIQGDPDDLILAGQLIAPRGGLLDDTVIAVGQVVGKRHAGRAFKLWHEAVY
jgi:hypothetical protein